MDRVLTGVVLSCVLTGCASGSTGTLHAVSQAGSSPAGTEPAAPAATAKPIAAVAVAPDSPEEHPAAAANGTWIGAAGASDLVLAGGGDTFMGVWVDVPSVARRARAPVSLALVVDTSGSMAGAKMDNARSAAKSLVDSLGDGDIVSIHTFADDARERVPPTLLDGVGRSRIAGTIAELSPVGGTNLFDGLRLGESRALSAPATHPVRRVVLVSDGIANVGPSTPDVLGAVAARGADQGVQVTAIGVGLDYDENTLNALAVRSSGRLYHMTEPREMAAILKQELKLLQATMATNAFVEIVPAPGVQLLGAEGIRADWQSGALRVPLGSMFGGQHREMLVRVRVTDAADGERPLASVRLHFRDPAEGNLERVQEVVAHYQVTRDALAVEQHQNSRTRAIMAVQEAAQLSSRAAQEISAGQFDAADKQLAAAEQRLQDSAKKVADARERDRIMAAAANVSQARRSAGAAAAAPPAARPSKARASSLELNSQAMDAMGF